MDQEKVIDSIRALSDLCDVILEAVKMDLVDRDVARSHITMYLDEIDMLIDKKEVK